MKFDWLTSRQAKYGAYSSAYILVAITILAAVNYLGIRYNKTFDATQNKLYSLSDQTIKVLDGLDQEVTRDYGTRCLIARRLVERGVRVVQLFLPNQPCKLQASPVSIKCCQAAMY